jgi:CheY-like chemotaxis protein
VFAPSAVVLDIGLPGMSGYELARRLREMPETRRALFIALTGYGQREDRALATEAGFHHHFIKPADPRAIHAVIDAFDGAGEPAVSNKSL